MLHQLRFLCVPQNLPTPLDDENSKRLSHTRKILIKTQNRNGSFGGKGTLESIVTTSQAVLALSALGDHRDQIRVERALKWLAKAKILNSEYSYWSLAPFNCSDGFDDEVEVMFQKANELAEADLKHHHNSPLPNFVLEQAALLERNTTFTKTEKKRLQAIFEDKESLTEEAAQVISHTTLVAQIADIAKEKDFPEINKILIGKAAVSGEAMRWPGNIASTCYVLINLLVLKAITATASFDDTIEKAYSGIVYAKDHGEILTTLPAGGEFAKPEAYTNAVILRAFVRYWLWKKGWRRIGITHFDMKKLKIRRLSFSIFAAVIITTIAWIAAPVVHYSEQFLVQGVDGIPDYWETLDRIANVLGLFGVPGLIAIFLLIGRYLYERVWSN